MPKSPPPKHRRGNDSLERKAEESVARMKALLTSTKAEVARSKNLVKRISERKNHKD
jgi:hypothetical protein